MRICGFVIVVVWILMVTSEVCRAQLTLKTWIGQGSGGSGTDFNSSSNWNPSGVPSSSDSCVMNFTSGFPQILTCGSVTIGALTVNASGVNVVAQVYADASTLTITGATIIQATGNGANLDLWATNSGSFVCNGNADFGTTGSGYVGLQVHSTGKFVFRGDVIFGLQATLSFPGKYVFDANGTQTLTTSLFYHQFSSVDIGLQNNPTVILSGVDITSGAVSGNLSINGTSTFDLSNHIFNRNAPGGSITIANGATLRIGGTGSFPKNYATHAIGTSSTVEYYGGNQTVSAETYGNLTINGRGTTKTLSDG